MLLCLVLAGCASSPQFIRSKDDVQIFYRTSGRGSPIVVLHGGPGMDHQSLANDLEPLARSHRLIYYDQRGGGRSTLPADTSRLTMDDHVSDLEALRVQLGLDRMTLLAHSFGPAIAASYAIAHPQRVERMIFLGPIPPRRAAFFERYLEAMSARMNLEDRNRLEELMRVFETGEGDVVAACREFWAIGVPPRLARGTSPSMVKSDLCAAPPEAIRYGMTKTNAAGWESLGEWDWTAALARVEAPVLVIHGEEDAIPMEMVREWAVSLPNGRMLELPGTGHFPHAERPEEVFAAIEAFMK